MQVFLINLDRDRDRLAHMRRALGETPFTRVAAVDGTKMAETANGLTRFEIACLESHREAWRLFLATGAAHASFLEDDLHLWPDFPALAADDGWVPADADTVKLDTYFQKVKLGERRSVQAGREVARLYGRHESSAAYLLSRAGAERYLALTEPPTLPADYAIFPKDGRRVGLTIYQLVPAVAIQDHLMPASQGGKTIATAMTVGPPGAPRRRRSALGKVLHEGQRLIEQASELREALYLEAFVRPETTTVDVG